MPAKSANQTNKSSQTNTKNTRTTRTGTRAKVTPSGKAASRRAATKAPASGTQRTTKKSTAAGSAGKSAKAGSSPGQAPAKASSAQPKATAKTSENKGSGSSAGAKAIKKSSAGSGRGGSGSADGKKPPNGKARAWKAPFFAICTVLLVLFTAWMVYLDAEVRKAFDGKKWALPAKVYARPLALYPGLLLTPEQLNSELRWADYRPDAEPDRPGRFRQQGDEWFIYRRGFPFWDGAEPSRVIKVTLENGRVARVADANGVQPLIRLEPQYIGGIFPSHNEDRELVPLDAVPPVLVAALIVTEDKHFFDHWGVSAQGIARAMVANVKAGRMVQGGSTLTQQLVKNFFLTNERSLTRKVQEAFMSLLLELHYDKEEILEAYINEVYLGQAGRRSINGFGLAARFYFGKPLGELNTAEIATLVGLVKGASYYNPRRHPERAKDRRDLILGLMADNGIITQAESLRAINQPLLTASPRRAGQREYPAFLELAKQQLQQDYRLQDLQTEGLRIFTTLDPWLQNAVENSSESHLTKLEARTPALKGKLETAAVITSVDGGEIRALLGARDASFFGFNRALNARRAVGSLAKPAVFLAALRSGDYHWGTLLDDSPVTVQGQDGSLWQPQNYDRQSHGMLPMADVLKRSLNQATARLGMTVGLEAVTDEMKRLGITSDLPPYPSLLLGAVSLSPLEVAQMYQTIASEGFLMPLRTIDAVTTGSGEMLSSYAIRGQQVYDPVTMQWLTAGLEMVVSDGTAKALRDLPQPLAGKTGTSDDQRDAWFAGFDNRHLGVIWVGQDDNAPMPYTGSSGALPIWRATFERAGVEPLSEARNLIDIAVDEQGQLLAQGCAGNVYAFPASWSERERKACESGASRLGREIRSWLDRLF